jgi:hypothetical protein
MATRRAFCSFWADSAYVPHRNISILGVSDRSGSNAENQASNAGGQQ